MSDTKDSFKFSVDHLAKALDVSPETARIQLRKHKIEKAGKAYGWNSKTELDAVVKKMKTPKAAAEKKPAAKKAPAKKAKAEAAE